MTTIEQDIDYAKTWCRNSNLRMLGERIERIAESHTALESQLAALRSAAMFARDNPRLTIQWMDRLRDALTESGAD